MRRIIALLMVVTFVSMVFQTSGGYAQNLTPYETLNAGIEAYQKNEFNQAINLLEQATNSGELNRETQLQGLAYLAVCYIFQTEGELANETIKRIVDIDPDFAIDESIFEGWIVDDFNNSFEQIKSRYVVSNIWIKSDPPAATVIIDGFKQENLTPLQLPMITVGSHKFTLERDEDNCSPQTQTLEITSSGQEIEFNLICEDLFKDEQPIPQKKSSALKWVLIGGGVLLAGGLAAVLAGSSSDDGGGGGNGDDDMLDDPPSFP